MQKFWRIFFYLFLVCTFFVHHVAFTEPSTNLMKEADELFGKRKYEKAMQIYEKIRVENREFSEQMLLKMSFIAERIEKNDAKALYFLTLCYELGRNEEVKQQVIQLAKKNGVQGHDFGDAAFFSELYAHYQWIIIFAVFSIFTALIFWLHDRVKKQKINRTKTYLFATLSASFSLLIVLNIEWKMPNGIIIAPNAHLYTAPSAASDVLLLLPKGTKLNVRNQTDVWQEVEWAEKIYFVRKFHLVML